MEGESSSDSDAAVLLDDLLDDRQAQPRTLGSGGDIGLDQAATILLGQADPVVDHLDADGPTLQG